MLAPFPGPTRPEKINSNRGGPGLGTRLDLCIIITQLYILSTLWMLNQLITYREWVFPNGAAAHADDAGWVEWPKHGGSLASIDNEQELIVPEQWRKRRGIQSGPLQWAGSVLPTTSNGRMCSHFLTGQSEEQLHLLFCHICSKASPSSMFDISSASWNFKKPSPPWPRQPFDQERPIQEGVRLARNGLSISCRNTYQSALMWVLIWYPRRAFCPQLSANSLLKYQGFQCYTH